MIGLLIAGPEPWASRLTGLVSAASMEEYQPQVVRVLGTATGVREARDLVVAYAPDVLALDTGGGGLDLLERLMVHRPLPVIAVVKDISDAAKARRSGAVEVIRRPQEQEPPPYRRRFLELVRRSAMPGELRTAAPAGTGSRCATAIVAIGASTGGPEAVEVVLRELPADAPGIVVAVHMPAQFSRAFAGRLDQVCRIRVKEAAHGDWVREGQALIAPGGLHLRVIRHGPYYLTTLDGGPKVWHQRPSVDVLFDSLLPFAHQGVTAVLLTGMGQDGAAAMCRLRKAGAWTIAQDEQTSVVYGMPAAAVELGGARQVLPLDAIAGAILNGCAPPRRAPPRPA